MQYIAQLSFSFWGLMIERFPDIASGVGMCPFPFIGAYSALNKRR